MSAVSGHFGEWLQGRLGADGPVVLITLPCAVLTVESGGEARQRLFMSTEVAEFFEKLGLDGPEPVLRSTIPPGTGCGASTATLVALARGAGYNGPPEALAQACLAVEAASDPLMYPEPDALLWASREARCVERLRPPPAARIVGGFMGQPIDTRSVEGGFPDIADLLDQWRTAIVDGDLEAVAAIASASATRLSTVRGEACPMPGLAAYTGALGHMRAHTGSARGLIFAPEADVDDAAKVMRQAGLTDVFTFDTRCP